MFPHTLFYCWCSLYFTVKHLGVHLWTQWHTFYLKGWSPFYRPKEIIYKLISLVIFLLDQISRYYFIIWMTQINNIFFNLIHPAAVWLIDYQLFHLYFSSNLALQQEPICTSAESSAESDVDQQNHSAETIYHQQNHSAETWLSVFFLIISVFFMFHSSCF